VVNEILMESVSLEPVSSVAASLQPVSLRQRLKATAVRMGLLEAECEVIIRCLKACVAELCGTGVAVDADVAVGVDFLTSKRGKLRRMHEEIARGLVWMVEIASEERLLGVLIELVVSVMLVV